MYRAVLWLVDFQPFPHVSLALLNFPVGLSGARIQRSTLNVTSSQ